MEYYSETIDFYAFRLGIYSKLNDYIEKCMYQRPISFFDHCPGSLRFH